jgi:hypothetical protein
MNQSPAGERVPCSDCGSLILPATSARTGGKCMQCVNALLAKQYLEKLESRRQAGDNFVDDYNLHYAGAPESVEGRERGISAFTNLIHFLQDNKLTRRLILKKGDKPDASIEIWESDLTEEGKKLTESCLGKWFEALDDGSSPDDLNILQAALAKLRGGQTTRPLTANKKGNAGSIKPTFGKKLGTAKVSLNESKASESMNPLEVDDRLEKFSAASGPHVYDKAKWHYEGDFPNELSRKQGFVHTGMFVACLF